MSSLSIQVPLSLHLSNVHAPFSVHSVCAEHTMQSGDLWMMLEIPEDDSMCRRDAAANTVKRGRWIDIIKQTIF